MKHSEWKECLITDGYIKVGIVSEIDRETVEDDPKYNKCQECGELLKYEGWICEGSYRALAVCVGCEETFEF